MRKHFIFVLIASLIWLAACTNANDSGPKLEAMNAWIDKPLHQSTHWFGPLEVLVHGSADAGIEQLEFSFAHEGSSQKTLVGVKSPDVLYEESMLGGETSSVLGRVGWTWMPPSTGDFTLFVRVSSPDGSWSDYAEADISVMLPDLPVAGLTIPQSPGENPPIGPTPTVTPTSTPTPTTTPTPSPTPPPAQIAGLPPSTGQVFYGGSSCSPPSVTFRVQASDPSGVGAMVFFYSLSDQTSGTQTSWSSGESMSPNDDGGFSLTRSGDQLARAAGYDGNNATVRYQFALQPNQGEILRSPVYSDLTLSRCISIIIPGPITLPTATIFTPR